LARLVKKMGKTFKDSEDDYRNKKKFSDRRKKKLRKIVAHEKELEVEKEETIPLGNTNGTSNS